MEQMKTFFAIKEDGKNTVLFSFQNGLKGKLTFLEEDIFRYDANFEGSFPEYAKPREPEHRARIQQYPDSSESYARPGVRIRESGERAGVFCKSVSIFFEKETGRMQVQKNGKVLFEEAQPLLVTKEENVQKLILRQG